MEITAKNILLAIALVFGIGVVTVAIIGTLDEGDAAREIEGQQNEMLEEMRRLDAELEELQQ